MRTTADVAIVGAGIAGLVAARDLVQRGLEPVVLEARDRVGGRTWTRAIGKGTFDLGGQWIGPTQKRIHALARELNLATFPTWTKGRKVLDAGGKLATFAGTIPPLSVGSLLGVHRLMQKVDRERLRVPLADPLRAPRALELDAMTVESWKQAHVSCAGARESLDLAVRAVFGVEPGELSLLHFLFYVASAGGLMPLLDVEGGAQETRFEGGAQRVSLALAASLGDRVVLSAPVRAIEQKGSSVTIRSDAGDVTARAAIVAIPPTLAARIVYTPELPWERDQLTQRAAMGATTKVIALYERAFWREKGLSGEALAFSGPVSLAFDNSSGDQPALLAFIVGRPARELARNSPEERRRLVLSTLARFFGDEALRPTEVVEQDWSLETWTRGCPVAALPPGTLANFGAALRAPVGLLHWAGTETATEWNGYMDGAVESGERAAREVAEKLRPTTG